MSDFFRRQWDSVGLIHRLRFGDYIAVLYWRNGSWIVDCRDIALRALSNPESPAGPDDIDEAKAWAIRKIVQRMDRRKEEDAKAIEDLAAMSDPDESACTPAGSPCSTMRVRIMVRVGDGSYGGLIYSAVGFGRDEEHGGHGDPQRIRGSVDRLIAEGNWLDGSVYTWVWADVPRPAPEADVQGHVEETADP